MKIVTFYSYKGGVGRSMCLANVGVQLAQWGHKVLLVDIEAPGLERYFVSENFNNQGASDSKFGIDLKLVKKTPGLIDLLSDPESFKWEKTLISISIPDAPAPIHLITAGKRDDAYFQRVRDFNVDKFYTEHNGGDYIESLRDAWSKQYDFVLIDSRTGITEINGICTIQMPDLVVLLFTATNQGFEGTLDIAQRADKAQQKLPYNRFKLMFLPVLTRVESSEFELTRGWIRNFAERLRDIYKYWLPAYINREQFMELTKIPHFPFFSFGEELAVVKQGTSDPSGMGYAYANIASLIANHLEKAEEFFEKREEFVRYSGKNGNATASASISVYINYNHADYEVAERIEQYLNANGFDVWFDRKMMTPGESIEAFIEKAHRCDFYLFIISSKSLQSGWVNYDVNTFLSKKEFNKFIPLTLDYVFFDNKFLISAMENFSDKINIIKSDLQQLEKLGSSATSLKNELNRLEEAHKNLPGLIETLRGLLVLDIGQGSFDISMNKVIKAMTTSKSNLSKEV
jgi:cellulose biosynthesis protein BcsQ